MYIPKVSAFLGELQTLHGMYLSDPERAERVVAIYSKHLLKPLTAPITQFNRTHFDRMLDETRLKVMTHMIHLPKAVTFKVPSLHHQLKSELTGASWYFKEVDNGWYLVSTHPDFPGSAEP